MKKHIIALALTVSAAAVNAGAAVSFYCNGYYPAGRVTLSISDAGHPGFVAVVAEAQSGEGGAFLSSSGEWVYDRMPWRHEYQEFASLPASISIDFCIPAMTYEEYGGERLSCNASMTSAFSAGPKLWVTWGALTPEIQADVDQREATFQARNARLIAAGKEPRTFDKQRWIESAILRDARQKNAQYVGEVPYIDCTPPDYGS